MFEAVIYELRIGDFYYIGSTKNIKTRKNEYKRHFCVIAENYDLITKDIVDFKDIDAVKRAWVRWSKDNEISMLNSKLACAFMNELVYQIREIDWVNVENYTEQRKHELKHYDKYIDRYGAENMMNGNDIICSTELYLNRVLKKDEIKWKLENDITRAREMMRIIKERY
tara:strand:- start:436 stop:942 length:507 start_codon:yes stop_codon:yes gene_type:complete